MRLIDADALERIVLSEGSYQNMVGVLEEDIDNAPTIEAEPVVRCRECKHYNDGDCTELPKLVDYDDYCSFGERREP